MLGNITPSSPKAKGVKIRTEKNKNEIMYRKDAFPCEKRVKNRRDCF